MGWHRAENGPSTFLAWLSAPESLVRAGGKSEQSGRTVDAEGEMTNHKYIC